MVYVARDGTIHETSPWSLDKLTKLFYGIIYFIIFFFKSLVGLDTSSYTYSGARRNGVTFRGTSGGGSGSSGSRGTGSGGGGSGPFRPGGGGGGSSRRFMTMRDINPPTMGGGCPGGSCGL